MPDLGGGGGGGGGRTMLLFRLGGSGGVYRHGFEKSTWFKKKGAFILGFSLKSIHTHSKR